MWQATLVNCYRALNFKKAEVAWPLNRLKAVLGLMLYPRTALHLSNYNKGVSMVMLLRLF